MKKPLLRLLPFLFICALPLLTLAQEIDVERPDDKPVEERLLYSRQNSIHVAIHSQGLGAGFKIGRIKSIYSTTNWEFSLASLHDLKEIKIATNYSLSARPYVYGKLNSVFLLRFGYGWEKRIFGKPYWGGVELRWTYEAGATLALMKPYYYYVIIYRPDSSGSYQEVYEEQTFDDNEQWMGIVGRAPFAKGLNEISLSPGIHAKTGLNFDIGTSRVRMQTVHFGVIAEYFPTGVSIIDSRRNQKVFVTLFLSYNWGSRFNKQ